MPGDYIANVNSRLYKLFITFSCHGYFWAEAQCFDGLKLFLRRDRGTYEKKRFLNGELLPRDLMVARTPEKVTITEVDELVRDRVRAVFRQGGAEGIFTYRCHRDFQKRRCL